MKCGNVFCYGEELTVHIIYMPDHGDKYKLYLQNVLFVLYGVIYTLIMVQW